MKKAFTLIELMVVIAIIGLLSAIVLPRFSDITDDARVAQVQGNLANLRTTIGIFHAKTDKYPVYEKGNLSTNDNGQWDISADGELSEEFSAFYSKSLMPATPAGILREEKSNTDQLSETNNVVDVRSNLGGWLYLEERGEIYANLADGSYTGDTHTEIWQEERVADNGGVDPEKPDTGLGNLEDFMGRNNVFLEGSNSYGSITFNQGDSGSTITPSEWHRDWERVYVFDETGKMIPNPKNVDGSYSYGVPIPVKNNNAHDYIAFLEKTDPVTGEKIYLYSRAK